MFNQSKMMHAALEYAAHGIAVFPLMPGRKTPQGDDDGKEYPATTDPRLIERWWTENPDCNIGHPVNDDMVVINLLVDPKYKNCNGLETLSKYEDIYGPLPSTASCSSEYGGCMLFYKGLTLNQDIIGVVPGINILCHRNYIVLPPSVTYQGEFRWERRSIFDNVTHVDTDVRRFINAAIWMKENNHSYKLKRYSNPYELPEYLIVPECGRDVFLSGQIDWMKDMGYSRYDIIPIIRDLNEKHCEPPYSEEELWDEVLDRSDLHE